MSNPIERYQKLAFKDSLSRIHHYPIACKDLSLILREAYIKLPKNLQSVVFQDTLAAFRTLPQMPTRSAVSAAHLLIQSAEAVLPKQRKNLALTEFKRAKVSRKRRCKAHHEEESTAELPQDVLVHIFSFLDLPSLVSVGLVCWSWNLAASNNQLWQSQYATFFGSKFSSSKTRNSRQGESKESTLLQDNAATRTGIDWREAFQRTYVENSSKKRLISNRGYCGQCETIVWLDNMKCCNRDHKQQSENQQIVPVSSHQVVDYLLNGSSSIICSSESDSESDEELIPRLWAYPRHLSRSQNK